MFMFPLRIRFHQSAGTQLAGGTIPPGRRHGQGADGTEVAVQTQIESMDKNVLDADPAQPGQFVARSQGQTQLHAVYRGKEVVCQGVGFGQAFRERQSRRYNASTNDHFDMTIEVLAASSEGELEYRVYAEGEPAPRRTGCRTSREGDTRKATLRSDPDELWPGRQSYHLVIEARDKTPSNVQKYPLTLVPDG